MNELRQPDKAISEPLNYLCLLNETTIIPLGHERYDELQNLRELFFSKRMVDILVTGIVTVQRSLIFCMLSLLYR